MIFLKSMLAGLGAAAGAVLLFLIILLPLSHTAILARRHVRIWRAGHNVATLGFIHVPHAGLILALAALAFFVAAFLWEYRHAKARLAH